MIDQQGARFVGGMDDGRDVSCPVAARHVSKLHFVEAGPRQVWHEAGGLLPFARVAILKIIFVDEVRGVEGFLPRTCELRRHIIDDDAAQFGRADTSGEGLFLFTHGLQGGFQTGDRCGVVFHRFRFLRRGERALAPTRRTPHRLRITGESGRAGEDAGQRVIIPRRDGVELVVVAAGTTHRQTEKGARGHVDLLVNDVHLQLVCAWFEQKLRPQHQKPRRDELFVALFVTIAGKQVPGELFANESVEGLVCVEGAHDVIAIAPRVVIGQVDFQAVGVGIARHVKPVPSPTFAKLRRRQQPIHDLGECLGGIVRQESLDFSRSGWQARKVERGAANQDAFVGRRSGFQL